MEIYFDDKLINEDYYTALSTNFALFGDTFYLGSTASNIYNISIAKEAITRHPSTVLIKDKGTLIATLVVDKVEENDFEYKYTLTDKMVNLEFNYDATECFANGSATLLEIVQDICNKAGIELAIMDFRGYNKEINWYDNTRTAREYIGYIAELNGGYAQIGKDGRLYFIKQNTPSAEIISIDDCADFEIGEKHVITRVVYEQGTLKYEYGDETGNTLYLNEDNVYITDQIEVEEIFNEIKGFEFYSFSTSNCPIDYNIMAGQIVTFTDGINNYPTIVGYELTYNGDWYGGYNIDVATKKQEETQVIKTDKKIRNLSIKVDRVNNKLTQTIEEVDKQTEKISEVIQSVDEVSQRVENMADVTNTVLGTKKISLGNCVEGSLLELHIYGNNTVFEHLFPSDDLYPSDTLYPYGDSRIIVTNQSGESKTYELGVTEVLRQNEEVADEYILKDGKAQIIRRVNADGTTKITEEIEELGTFSIAISEGTNIIEIKNYTAKIEAKFAIQNDYTNIFATKVEMKSSIKQTADEINLEVKKKVDEKEVCSVVSQSAEEILLKGNRVLIESDNFVLNKDGTVTCKNANIIGGKLNISSQIGENRVRVYGINATTGKEVSTRIAPNSIDLGVGTDGNELDLVSIGTARGEESFGIITIIGEMSDDETRIYNGSANFWENDNQTTVGGDGITTPSVTQTSLEMIKKNIALYKEDTLEIIKNAEIYSYNLKSEKDEDKKHIGFVIGDKYKTPEDVIAKSGEGIDTYAMTSILWKAVQELTEKVEKLEGGQANG